MNRTLSLCLVLLLTALVAKANYHEDMANAFMADSLQLPALVDTYGSRALEDPDLAEDSPQRLEILLKVAGARSKRGGFRRASETCLEAADLARRLGDKPNEYQANLILADIGWRFNDYQMTFDNLDIIINGGKDSSDPDVLAKVAQAHGIKARSLYFLGHYKEALAEAEARMKMLDALESSMPEEVDSQRARSLSRMALAAHRLGRDAEAANYAAQFMQTNFGKTSHGAPYIAQYYLETGHFKEAIEVNKGVYKEVQKADTNVVEYANALHVDAQSYAALGDFRKAYELMRSYANVADTLYNREMQKRTAEAIVFFDLTEKQLQIQQARGDAAASRAWIIGMSIVVLLLIGLTVMLIRQYKQVQERHRDAARRLDELMNERADIRWAFRQAAMNGEVKNDSFTEFMQMENRIISEGYFLSPDVTRDKLAQQCGISRSKLLNLIHDHAGGVTPGEYIDRLRLQHSVELMRQHPEWTIDAIATESGFLSRNTYYQHFNKLFGLTPAQYRHTRLEEGGMPQVQPKEQRAAATDKKGASKSTTRQAGASATPEAKPADSATKPEPAPSPNHSDIIDPEQIEAVRGNAETPEATEGESDKA